MRRRALLFVMTLVWMAVWVPPAIASFHLKRADGSSPSRGLSIPATLVLADVHWPVLDAPARPRAVKVQPAAHRPTGDVWGRLRGCESSDGRSSPDGLYHNWFQFDVPTWHGVGGQGHPRDASYPEALKRAKILQANRGWAPWPSCSRQLGLR